MSRQVGWFTEAVFNPERSKQQRASRIRASNSATGESGRGPMGGHEAGQKADTAGA